MAGRRASQDAATYWAAPWDAVVAVGQQAQLVAAGNDTAHVSTAFQTSARNSSERSEAVHLAPFGECRRKESAGKMRI